MKLYEIVFSATGRTQKVVDVISSVFGKEKNRIDLSELNSESKIYNISEDSFCIIAVPVYNGRVPIPAVNRLRNIYGNNANALLVAVYGNRAIDDCLLELKKDTFYSVYNKSCTDSNRNLKYIPIFYTEAY